MAGSSYTHSVQQVRINRALAMAGAASRRGAEELVRSGRVKLNGSVVKDLATTLDPARDRLELDGRALKLQAEVYYAYYKPRGQVCTMRDERWRECTGDICAGLAGNPRPVGRLDRESEGLLLLTNDGALANRLMHPRYAVLKEYQATVEPRLTERHARQLISGIDLEPLPNERPAPGRFTGIEVQAEEPSAKGGRSRLLVQVSEGRYRFIRRMFESLGHAVLRLKRLRLGPLRLSTLKPNEYRPLSSDEVMQLKRLTGLWEERSRKPRTADPDRPRQGRPRARLR